MEIKPKMKYTGTIIKLGLAGAVVDIGANQPAVLHISQLPPETKDSGLMRVEEMLELGQKVEVWIRRVKEDHIELTMRKPLDLEWREIKPGMTVKGKVVRIEKFGAFVEIGAERPGLIHISELAHGYVRSPEEVIKNGEEVEVEVLEVQRKKKQIKLSMKALQEMPEEESQAQPVNMGMPRPAREKPPRRKKERKPRSRKSGDFTLSFSDNDLPQGESEPTAMEIALRDAMDRAKKKEQSQDERVKPSKSSSDETQDEILSRTLENKVKTN